MLKHLSFSFEKKKLIIFNVSYFLFNSHNTISFYGKAGQDDPDFTIKEERRCLYRAPELLRCPSPPLRGSQKGDVYSFGIVLYEILGRCGPWGPLEKQPAGEE